MNARYSFALALLGLASAANAQLSPTLPTQSCAKPSLATYSSKDAPTHGVLKSGGDIVWNEDFANGLAGNTPAGAWSTALADGNLWQYHTTGPVGAYSNATAQIIGSATAANGFMIFLSDSANSIFTPDTVLPASPFINWDGALVSPVLDLSATPAVQLVFQQRMRYCCGDSPHFLEVSSDGGATWPSRFPLITVGANTDPGTLTTSVNITAAISANPANVRLRFFHDGTASGTSHYNWQIDDVQLIELFEFDLSMTGSSISSFDSDLSFSYDSLRYSIYPYGQLRPVPLNMTVLNNGTADQTNVTANFLVEESGSTVLDQDEVIANFPAGATQTIFADPGFTPPAVAGTYDITYSVNSTAIDNTPGDNGSSGEFKVDPNIYARDLGTATGFEDGDGVGGPYILCNGFHITNETELYSVDVALRSGGSPSPLGNTIVGTLQAGDLTSVLAETEEHEIVASDLNSSGGSHFVSLIFADPQLLEAGGDYFVCIQTYGGNVRTGQNGVSEEQTSFIFFDGPSGEDWYYTTTTPMVRMNFDPTIGIEEQDYQNGVGLGQSFPNPANQTATIPFDLTTGSSVGFAMHDVSGKLMLSSDEGVKSAGTHRITVNTLQLPEGVYFYTLTAGGTQLTKRMTVIH